MAEQALGNPTNFHDKETKEYMSSLQKRRNPEHPDFLGWRLCVGEL